MWEVHSVFCCGYHCGDAVHVHGDVWGKTDVLEGEEKREKKRSNGRKEGEQREIKAISINAFSMLL